MDEQIILTTRFEENRPRLRAIAYRMLGSASEADDAVQETWLRLNRTATSADSSEADAGAGGEIENVAGWLTTVVSRVCLNILRARESRREDLQEEHRPEVRGGVDPEEEVVLADSVGLAMVLDALNPAERIAFVLHDMFAVPFDDIGPMIDRTPAAVRQLASRARRRVQGTTTVPMADLVRQRRVVDAFLAASRGGDFEALLALLDPDVVLHADPAVGPTPAPIVLQGIRRVAKGALLASERVRSTRPALVDGSVGLVMAPRGQLQLVLTFTITEGRITGIDVIAEPDRLHKLELAVLDA